MFLLLLIKQKIIYRWQYMQNIAYFKEKKLGDVCIYGKMFVRNSDSIFFECIEDFFSKLSLDA
jgi:hypothetical protein